MQAQDGNIRIPDVSGFRLERALKLLESSGVESVTVRRTAPPRLKYSDCGGDARVVAQKVLNGGNIELLVCNANIE
ncbi:MAG: PASTA domain-containing protein [Bacillota bacterium]